MENSSFFGLIAEAPGVVLDDSTHNNYPVSFHHVMNGAGFNEAPEDDSIFVYCYAGELSFVNRQTLQKITISKGMFCSLAGRWMCLFSSGRGFIVQVHNDKNYKDSNYKAYTLMGGPLECTGRLKYIDGCTDSLLIPPVKMGDPCLNHLHFPPNIDQTPHTHPSHRIGMVTSGEGECITPFGNVPLKEGMLFIIKEWDGKTMATGLDGKEYAAGTHSFRTFEKSMNVIAFHPDSDFGPTDEIHPMINRTIVNGVSASKIESIRTK